jgi:hypothetical protein
LADLIEPGLSSRELESLPGNLEPLERFRHLIEREFAVVAEQFGASQGISDEQLVANLLARRHLRRTARL